MLNIIFWFTYAAAIVAAWFATFQVFSQSDPWYVALLAATAIDGALAYLLYLVGVTHKNQRAAGLAAIVLYASISGFAQVIHRYHQLGVPLPDWLAWVSLALVPLSTTGSVVILGFVKSLDLNRDGRITRDEIMAKFDRNRDGRIGLDDFIARKTEKPAADQRPKAVYTNEVPGVSLNAPKPGQGLNGRTVGEPTLLSTGRGEPHSPYE